MQKHLSETEGLAHKNRNSTICFYMRPDPLRTHPFLKDDNDLTHDIAQQDPHLSASRPLTEHEKALHHGFHPAALPFDGFHRVLQFFKCGFRQMAGGFLLQDVADIPRSLDHMLTGLFTP